MTAILAIIVVLAAVFGSEWLVDSWLGEVRRVWIGIAGIALLLLSGALVKASGINALTRVLRGAVVGAGIGAVLNRTGLRLGWLRSALRLAGIETEPGDRNQAAPQMAGRLLTLGWAGSLVGLGLIWTGIFAG